MTYSRIPVNEFRGLDLRDPSNVPLGAAVDMLNVEFDSARSLTLFASDLVQFVIGERWRGAVGLLEAFGVIAAINHVAFNWGAFYRARGDTRPAAVLSAVVAISFFVATLPGLLLWGLDGLAGGMAMMAAASMVARLHYVGRLFPEFRFTRHALRALAPTVPAAAAVLLARVLESGQRAGTAALAELVLFVVVCAASTVLLERNLLREAFGYLRRRAGIV